MNAPILLLIIVWLLYSFSDIICYYLTRQRGVKSPIDIPPADPDEEADNLPFGPTPNKKD